MSKQNSVEFLYEALVKHGWILPPLYKVDEKLLDTLLQQAKALHREEVTSFTADWSIQWKYEDGKSINEFYNERFGGSK